MEQIVLSPIPLDLLKSTISEIIREELVTKDQRDLQEKLLSPKDVCQLFQPSISKVTLEKWSKAGKLKKHTIGGRVYYRYSELIDSLQTLKKYNRN